MLSLKSKKHIFFIILIALAITVLWSKKLCLAQEKKSTSSLSGKISLPNIHNKGNLYVALYTFDQILTEIAYYIKIPKENISSTTVLYKISDIVPGEYMVYAIWDLAEPYIEVSRSRGINIKVWPDEERWQALSIAPQDGDYQGKTKVKISEGSSLRNIDIDCKKPTRWVWSNDTETFGIQYSFVKLTLDREDIAGPRLLLKIKNTDIKEIAQVNLLVFINGWMTNWFKTGIGKGFIDESGEFDAELTDCLRSYYQDKANRNRPRNRLSFRIFAKENESVLHNIIEVSDDVIKELNVEEDNYGSSPVSWGLSYKILDIRAQKQADGKYSYFMKLKNNSTKSIDQMSFSFIVNGKHSNNTIGLGLGSYETKEFDVTYNADSQQEEGIKIRHFYIIGLENDDYLERLIELD